MMLPHITHSLNHLWIWGPHRRIYWPFSVTLSWVRAELSQSCEVDWLRSTSSIFDNCCVCPDRLSAAVRTGIETARSWSLPPTQSSTKKKIAWLWICTPSSDFMLWFINGVTNLTLRKLESQIQSDRNLAPLCKTLIWVVLRRWQAWWLIGCLQAVIQPLHYVLPCTKQMKAKFVIAV